jgi:hypothetical protein
MPSRRIFPGVADSVFDRWHPDIIAGPRHDPDQNGKYQMNAGAACVSFATLRTHRLAISSRWFKLDAGLIRSPHNPVKGLVFACLNG